MISSLFISAALPAAVLAHDHGAAAALWARQGPSSASSAAASSNAATTAPATGTATPVSVSLLSTNPTAIPLASITPSISNQPTTTFSTPSAGATPTYMKGAPPLPDLSTIHPSNYPALDVIPPTDSPEVKQWIAEVVASGRTIPNITQTVPGGCAANMAAVNDDANRCWWSCGGCVRDSDITTCPDKLTWGLTYDDGPAPYTPNLLQYLDQQNLKATFFVVGSRCISYPALLQNEYLAGHQISVHTWSHHYLTQMTNDQIIAELGWSRKIIKDVLGVTPNTFRPPFGDIDDRVRQIALAMGLTPVMWTRISKWATFDTDDFSINGGLTSASQVLSNWGHILGNASTIDTGFIVLEHDLFPQTVDIATGYILPDALAYTPKLDIKPVIQCLNKPMSDSYVETNDNKTNPTGSQAAPLSTGAPGSLEGSGSVSKSGSAGASASHSAGSNGALRISSSAFVATAAAAAVGTVFGVGAMFA